jgi:cytidylate kinase
VIIAIDGPAGSGKSTTAHAVALRLGFRHLDSGAFYRALTLAALRSGWPSVSWPDLEASQLDALGIHAQPADTGFRLLAHNEDLTHDLRSPDVNAHVSLMARVPAVRAWLLDRLRETARATNLVADGRDMGTVVFPTAQLKIFLTAERSTRARRRLAEQGIEEPAPDEIEEESARLIGRDRIDSERAIAPLRPAADAIPLDTTRLSFAEQVELIVGLARERGAQG